MQHTGIRATFVLLAAALGTLPIAKAAILDFPVTPVTDGIYVIYGPKELPTPENRGFRNNPAIVLTKAGVVLIDPGGSVAAGELVLKKLKTVTDRPVVAVFDTHIHGDHWLGNAAVKAAYPKVTIYGHAKMRALAESAEGERWTKMINDLTQGANGSTKPVAPNATVKDGDLIRVGDIQFRIHHPQKAHTDNDLMIEVVGKNTLFTGDVVRDRMVGQMEGGSFEGNVKAIDRALAINARLNIPGHGQAGGPELLKAYRGYLATLYGTVKKLYVEGIADFEMKPKVVKALSAYKDWWGFDEQIGPQISQAYLEVEAQAF